MQNKRPRIRSWQLFGVLGSPACVAYWLIDELSLKPLGLCLLHLLITVPNKLFTLPMINKKCSTLSAFSAQKLHFLSRLVGVLSEILGSAVATTRFHINFSSKFYRNLRFKEPRTWSKIVASSRLKRDSPVLFMALQDFYWTCCMRYCWCFEKGWVYWLT